MDQSEPTGAEKLLPLVYDELRRLAASKLADEPPGQTLQATALVHEAYLRLVGPNRRWEGRRHFFAAAAEAMRRILVERARHKRRQKHGGGRRRVDLVDGDATLDPPGDDLIALDEALERLAAVDPKAAELVKLRHFCGLSTEDAGELLGLSGRQAYRVWEFARTWLYRRLNSEPLRPGPEAGTPT